MKFPFFLLALGAFLAVGRLPADPLSRKLDVDFYTEVDSRDLRGLAARSDGRLVAGSSLTELAGVAPAELLWCIDAAAGDRWLLGTGPEAKIFEITVDPMEGAFSSHELARLDDAQVLAIKALPGGAILAGTSPKGGLYLLRGGRIRARAALPADSVLAILALGTTEALVATGNPGRIYRVDLAKFAASGVAAEKLPDSAALAARGVTLFAQIRDRNVRQLARLNDGRIVAGSAPMGNIYAFPAPSFAKVSANRLTADRPAAEPLLLQENHEAEVTDLLPLPDGGFLAAVVFSAGAGEFHLDAAPAKLKAAPELPPPAREEKFGGRSVLTLFPADGFPEVLTGRFGAAFYHLAREGSLVLISGGEKGDLTGYDLEAKLGLTFAGSASARLNGIVPIPGAPGRFLVLRNNAPGLAILDFHSSHPREARTRVLDLGAAGRLGALRIDRLRDLAEAALTVDIQASNGTDDVEGWSPWTRFASSGDGWRGPLLRGRYVRLRLSLPASTAPTAEIDRAALYFLPQNRRPHLQDFRLLPANWALIVAPAEPPSAVSTLGQLLQPKDDDKHKGGLLASQVVPSPGTQAVYWTVSDPDGDSVVCTFSIRRDGDSAWTDLAVDTRDSYAQFDTGHLSDGVYFTRLVARETAPRPPAERLSASFETDQLVIDHTPPEILEASARRSGDTVVVSVRGRDGLSLLDGIEVNFNNGAHEVVDQPADGIRDGREKTFVLEEPVARAAGATAVEVTLYDAAGNGTTRRLALPLR